MANKHAQLLEHSVSWFDKHYSPSKKFRKREIEASKIILEAEDDEARQEYRLDQAWEQKYTANFGRPIGSTVPKRLGQQGMMIKTSPSHTWVVTPSFSDTWVKTWVKHVMGVYVVRVPANLQPHGPSPGPLFIMVAVGALELQVQPNLPPMERNLEQIQRYAEVALVPLDVNISEHGDFDCISTLDLLLDG